MGRSNGIVEEKYRPSDETYRREYSRIFGERVKVYVYPNGSWTKERPTDTYSHSFKVNENLSDEGVQKEVDNSFEK